MNKKNTLIIFSTYLIIILMAFLFYPLTEKITYIEQIKEGFFTTVVIGPFYAILHSFIGFPEILFSIIMIIGNVLPIILIYYRKKILPYIIFNIIFFCIYIFIGIIGFGIRHGEH